MTQLFSKKAALTFKSGIALIALLLAFALPAQAGDWTLDNEASKLAFGSVKKNTAGEVHHFSKLSGKIMADGAVHVAVDVSSVETFIEIRNTRFARWIFDKAHPKAMLHAKIDMAKVDAMKPGETAVLDVTGKLTLNGKDLPIETEMFVARLSDNKPLASSNEMIMLSLADAGLNAGTDELQKVAKLSGITRVSPVTLRLVFNR